MTQYSTPNEVWKTLGKDAITKVRNEEVGEGDGVRFKWDLAHDNILTNTLALYTDGTLVTDPLVVYPEDGKFEFTASPRSVLRVDYDYTDIPESKVEAMIKSSDEYINFKTGRKFGKITGSVEYLDRDGGQNVYFLKNYPVITISNIQIDEGGSSRDLNPEEFSINDEDKRIGRIRLNVPAMKGYGTVKVNYDHGTEVPPTINELSILLTIKEMVNSSIYKSLFKGYEFNQQRVNELNGRIEELIGVNRNISFGKI